MLSFHCPYNLLLHRVGIPELSVNVNFKAPEVVFFGAIFKRVSSPLPPGPGGDGNVLKVSKVPAVVTGWDDQDGLPLIQTDGTYHSARCRVKSDNTHFAPFIVTPFAILLHFIEALNDIIE